MKHSICRILLGLLIGVGVLGCVVWMLIKVLPTRASEYSGQSLEYWLEQRQSTNVSTRKAAAELVTNTIVPRLMYEADHETDWALRVWLVERLNRMPHVRIIFQEAEMRRTRAVLALGLVGRVDGTIEPFLLRKLDDASLGTKLAAAGALCDMKVEPDKLVPTLVKWLNAAYPDGEEVAMVVMPILAHFGPAAQAAVPTLERFLHSQAKGIPESAVEALRHIVPTATFQPVEK